MKYLKIIIITITTFSMLSGRICAQQYISQDGRIMDANTRIGSLGLNSSVRIDSLAARGNATITGNVSGGSSFQGIVPYSSGYEFQGVSSSSTLSNFNRDSYGVNSLGAGRPTFYVDPSRSVATIYGGKVMNTRQFNTAPLRVQTQAQLPARNRQYYQSVMSRPLYSGFSLKSPLELKMATSFTSLGQQANAFSGVSTTDISTGALYRQSTGRREGVQDDSLRNRIDFSANSRIDARTGRSSEDQEVQDEAVVPRQLPILTFPDQETAESIHQNSRDKIRENPELSDEERQPTSKTGIPIKERASVGGGKPALKSDYAKAARAKFDQHFNIGRRYLKTGQFYRAVNSFDLAAIYLPDDPQLNLARTGALFAAGEFMSAAYYLNLAMTLNIDLALAKNDVKALLGDDVKFQAALAELELWHGRTGNPMLLFLAGYVNYQSGQFDRAQEALTESLKIETANRNIKILLEAVEKTLVKKKPGVIDASQ